MLPVSLAAGAALGEAAKQAVTFDQEMEKVHTQAGASQQEVDALTKSVLAMAPVVGSTPEQLAEGLYHIESAGFRGAQALQMLGEAAKGAAIGGANLEDVTQAMVGTMAVGLPDVTNASDAMAYLNEIVGIGDMRMDKLSMAIATGVLPSFKSAGLGMNDFGAALATVTDNVTPADEAATRLRMTVALMSAPSAAAASALAKIGMSSTQMASDMRQPNGLLVAIEDLKQHLDDSNLSIEEQHAVLEKAFGGGKTSGTILTLIDETDRLKSKYEALGTATQRASTYQDAWAAQQQQANQKLKDFQSAVDVAGVKLGNGFLPQLTRLANDLAKLADGFSKLSPGMQTFIANALLAVAILGPAVMMLGGLATAIGALLALDPIVWIVVGVLAAIGLVVFEIMTHWTQLKDWFSGLFKDIKNVFKVGIDAIQLVVGVLTGNPEEIHKAWKQLADKDLPAALKSLQDLFSSKVPTIISYTNPLAAAALNIINDWQKVEDFFAHLGSNIAAGIRSANTQILSALPGGSALASVAHTLRIPGFASGVSNFSGGLALVGEQGPELVNLPSGAGVTPAGPTADYMSGNGQGGNVTVNVNLGMYAGEAGELRQVAKNIYLELMRVAKTNGTALPAIGVYAS